MTEETKHYAVVEVEEDEADVTISGTEHDIAVLREYQDLAYGLYEEFKNDAEKMEELDGIDVDVEPRKGLAGFDSPSDEPDQS